MWDHVPAHSKQIYKCGTTCQHIRNKYIPFQIYGLPRCQRTPVRWRQRTRVWKVSSVYQRTVIFQSLLRASLSFHQKWSNNGQRNASLVFRCQRGRERALRKTSKIRVSCSCSFNRNKHRPKHRPSIGLTSKLRPDPDTSEVSSDPEVVAKNMSMKRYWLGKHRSKIFPKQAKNTP
jgi:hypothetical protein